MWWLDPGKEVLNVVFNRILAPYIENLDMNQVNYGIGQGQLTLKNLRLRKGALDKFRLPVDVLEGHLGEFTLSLHWMNLGNQPVEIHIEDVYLLVVPSPQTKIDPEEEEERAQAAKAERLKNAELLHVQSRSELTTEEDSQQSQGLIASLIAKVVNNLQVTVKNIHVRYEDKMSVPGHPFACGITLAGLSAVSTDENWVSSFIESAAGAIHKLGKLQSLAVYFDTDSESLAGLPPAEAKSKFAKLISYGDYVANHQFILKPVTGEGRIVMNNKLNQDTPRFDVQLLFNEIGVLLDDNQYRDVISLVDMFHFYTRQHQYRKFRPSDEELKENRGRALLRFAGRAVLDGIHERNRRWTWAYIAERRDDRKKYVELFKAKSLNPLSPSDAKALEALEKKLSYEDIRFYRSIARSQLRKDLAARKKLEESQKKQQAQERSTWTGWLWGSSGSGSDPEQQESAAFSGEMTEEQRKQLYDVLDYDEKTALRESLQAPRDALKARVTAQLDKGSFVLKADPRGKAVEVISVVFDGFGATVLQRPDNLETSVSLGGFRVYDGTTASTLYPQIVRVKEADDAQANPTNDPFFSLKFEQNPLDERADTALSVKMRPMEIIYHKGYVEAVYKFFKPPASQLESVEALLDVASQTFEGLRKETRAGLEYALQTHKTVDLHVDMSAPIIIIPEDITTNNCKHLIVDAGHISIESDLADKNIVREMQAKRNRHYTEEDQKKLEELMYDRLSLRLEAAQFLLGNDLQSCRKALTASEHDSLHLLERVNLDLQVQNSIVPSAVTLARVKVSGNLPSLQVNLSDTKYKSLMRLIDVAVPHFDDDEATAEALTSPPQPSSTFQLPSGFFAASGSEYHVETDDEDSDDADEHDEFFEAEADGTERHDLHQHIFEFNFRVDTLRVALLRSGVDGLERPVGDVRLDRFALAFALAKFDMKVDVNLRDISMNVTQPGRPSVEFMSSADSEQDKDLLTVAYSRVQKTSPEYLTVYEGIDQNIDIRISTFVFYAAPEPVLALYDFIMNTFVPTNSAAVTIELEGEGNDEHAEEVPAPPNANAADKIRVVAKLDSVKVMIINEEVRIATLSLSTADVSVVLRASTMRIAGRLGNLSLSDDSPHETSLPAFKQIMSIEGDNFVEFRYQTFDTNEQDPQTGVKATVYFAAASIKLHFLEQPLHDIYLFVTKLGKLKGLYDAASQAAIQSASEIERMQFEVSVKSPIVIIPSDPTKSRDVLVVHLGEIGARNNYRGTTNTITSSLRGIQLASNFYYDNELSTLKIVDDININAEIVQVSAIDRTKNTESPDLQISVQVSDIKLYLTQIQYGRLIALSESIPRVLAAAPRGSAQADQALGSDSMQLVPADSQNMNSVDLEPELKITSSSDATRPWTNVDLILTIGPVKLHLYDETATTESNLKSSGIATFALSHNTLRFKLLSDGSGEAELVLKSFTMNNTRPGNSKFRGIIPAARHDRNQVMVLYTMSGGPQRSALAIVTIDAPQIIFAVDPLFSLVNFFLSAFPSNQASSALDDQGTQEERAEGETSSTVDFRVDLHDVSISILEDDSSSDTQAIRLSVKKLLVSQQGILAMSTERLGMSLVRMGEKSEEVRFLDDVDLTFTLDQRTSADQQLTNIEVSSKPIVFRASYRDILLINNIVNRAIEVQRRHANPADVDETTQFTASNSSSGPMQKSQTISQSGKTRSLAIGQAHVVVSKEQFTGSFEGFRFVLIGDLYEQPMLHLRVKPFIFGAKDWSGELQATTTLASQISYWNLTNSNWEPLIDPWTFTASVTKQHATSGLTVSLSSRERLDLNVSTTFVELAMTTLKVWGKEGARVMQKARGSYAPYRIRNRTGCALNIWSDIEGNRSSSGSNVVKLSNEQVVDWRFDDWKAMREHVSSTGHHNIGVQFVGRSWEHLRSIPVDREGEYTFKLRPQTEKYPSRLLCEVKVQDNVKIVTLRSTYKVENQTLYPVEITLVDESGQPTYSLEKIAPGQDFCLPMEAVGHTRIRLQPDKGFGYRWSPALRWEDLIAKKSFTLKCPHMDENEAAFRFQAWVQTDFNDPIARKYPKINVKLRAPIELENLLPYNLQYRIYDKNTDQNWRSYLRKGGVMPVHSVELGHLVLLNVQVEDTVFKPSEFAIINPDPSSDLEIDKGLILKDVKERRLDLKLNYVRYPESGGAFKVQIYSPYLVINKTGLPLTIKIMRSTRPNSPQEAAGETRSDTLSKPVPFMLSHPQSKRHEFIFKLGDSSWSRVINLDAPTADMQVTIPSESQRSQELQIGVSWEEGTGKYKLTKVVTLTPRFLVKNNLSEPICFREHGVAPQGRLELGSGQRTPLTFTRAGQAKLLTIAFPGLNAQWSSPIKIEDIGSVYFRVRGPGDDNAVHLIRADVKIDGSTIFVSFTRDEDGWPFIIENESDFPLSFLQADADSSQGETVSKARPVYRIPEHSTLRYAWDYPAARDKKVQLQNNDARRVIDIKEIGALVPWKFSGSRAVSLDVRADGPKQILRITNYNPEVSLYKPKRRQTVSSVRSDTTASSQDAFEAVTEEMAPTFTTNVDFEGIGLSLVNRKLVEVVYLSMKTLHFEFSTSPEAQAVTLSCQTLQIDNQLHDAIFPVVLQPTPLSKEATGIASLPTVQASVIWLNDEAHGVLFVKYCSVLLQALTVEADEDFLFAVYDLTQFNDAFWEQEQADILIQYPEDIAEPQNNVAGRDLYFEVLELQPIRLSISFMRTERLSGEQKLTSRNPLTVIVNALTMTLGNVNDAPLELNALAIKDMRLTLPDLENRIIIHYRQDVLRQLYRILGSADFIGNPVGLFTNVSSGVADIFYEPWNGVVMHGNRELGIGIAKGAASFVKKTVFGVTDSMTKITSSVGKGLSAATFDSEYQIRRRMAQRRNKPRHAIYGVTAGAEAFANSVASGVEGVVLKPIEGAESGGAAGFFRGVGKGLVGAVTKPMIGVFDLASNVSEGIRNTTTVFDSPARDRARLPRLIPADSVLRPYSAREALGQYWLKDVEQGRFRQESYVAHIDLPGGDSVVILTPSRILAVSSKRLRLEWELAFSLVQGVTIEDTGIRFAHVNGRDHDKFVFIPDKNSQAWFFEQVASVVKAWNVRKRMDI